MASASAGSWGSNISANREVDMDFLPSELFSSVGLQNPEASIIEGGIAGTVNMRSARPFDKAGFRSALHAQRQLPRPEQAVGYDGLRTRQQHFGIPRNSAASACWPAWPGDTLPVEYLPDGGHAQLPVELVAKNASDNYPPSAVST